MFEDDGYQKWQDAFVAWTEQIGTDTALNFQEPEGCASIGTTSACTGLWPIRQYRRCKPNAAAGVLEKSSTIYAQQTPRRAVAKP
jgi:hypothetical protein